jgi:DNA-binding CsgD family transcriptional regulator
MLQGRTAECATLDRLLIEAQAGRSQALLLCGDPGIGKTALLDYLAERASNCRVIRAVGIESEMELPFAGLHQLCGPLLDRLDRLPGPQATALATAFGLSAGDPPGRFIVGLALLSLLGDVAEEEPFVCIVDDAHWLDRVSAQTLAFVARRLLAERVALVFAVRHGSAHELGGLSELAVHGLGERDARALLDSVLSGPVDERVRERIVAETGGNPLALLELARLTPSELAGGFGLLKPVALPAGIEQSYVRRLQTLSDDAQRLLLVAAAEPIGDPLLVWRAAEQLGIAPGAADDVRSEGLLEIGERVVFRHPLVRSAIYRSAPVEQRRAVHLTLAEATGRDVDPDRRAWHLAAATPGPDDEIALELEQSAARAEARGGVAATAAFLQRAVALTQDPALRAERALAAAQASFQAGAFETALGLVATAESSPLDGYQSARSNRLRVHIAYASSWGSDAAPLLLEAARRLEPFDLDLARRAYLTAWGAAITGGHLGAGAARLLEICRAIRDLPPPAEAPHPLDLLLEGLALLTTDGRALATPVLQRAAKAIVGMPAEDVLRWGTLGSGPSAAIWDSDGFSAILDRQARIVRDAGALAELPIHLSALAMDKALIGDFASADFLLAESDSVAAVTGSPIQTFGELGLRGLRGREAEATVLFERTLGQVGDTRGGEAAMSAHWAAAVLYNGLARYDEAVSEARQVTSNAIGPWYSVWVLPELVEAATRVGDAELARDALERLAESTQPARTPFALGIEARSRALVSDGARAEGLYLEAIEQLSRTQRRPELARTHLLHGEWLRRDGRRVDARERLRTAYDMFETIGMEAFAERARRELLATGERVRKRSPETRDDLTPQEEQIARLARDGLSNSEIGAQLFLSPRTVEWHLHNVFVKLGISSRKGLRRALGGSERELIQA